MSCRAALLGAASTLAALALLVAPSGVQAEYLTGLNDTGLYVGAERNTWFDVTEDAEAGIVRLDVGWDSVATSTPTDPANPADPAYDFAGYDAAIQEAAARGLRVMITFGGAPEFAQGEDRPEQGFAGTWKPNPAALGDFAQAVATRYSGSFGGLPQVRYYEAWNEPNLDAHLAPQYEGTKPFAPQHYRRMVNSVEQAVSSVRGDNRVIAGSLAPYGDPPGGSRTRPLEFLRDFFCLSNKLKAVKCSEKPRLDVLSHHPINLSGPPRQSAIDPDDASSPDLKNVVRVLRAAEKEGAIAGKKKRHPVWVTEFWWESFPDSRVEKAIPGLRKHGRWIQEALYLFWKQGAEVAVNLQLIDTPIDPEKPQDTFQTGLLLENGEKKPAYTAFRFPFVTERRSKSRLFAWGKAPASGKLTIERKQGGGWKRVKRVKVKDGKVFTTKLEERGKAKYRARIGSDKSLPWSQGKGSKKGKSGKNASKRRPTAAADPAPQHPWYAENPSP